MLIPSDEAARRIGVAVSTLGTWRKRTRRGVPTGPQGWVAISARLVCYPEDAIQAFIEERRQRTRRAPLTIAAG